VRLSVSVKGNRVTVGGDVCPEFWVDYPVDMERIPQSELSYAMAMVVSQQIARSGDAVRLGSIPTRQYTGLLRMVSAWCRLDGIPRPSVTADINCADGVRPKAVSGPLVAMSFGRDSCCLAAFLAECGVDFDMVSVRGQYKDEALWAEYAEAAGAFTGKLHVINTNLWKAVNPERAMFAMLILPLAWALGSECVYMETSNMSVCKMRGDGAALWPNHHIAAFHEYTRAGGVEYWNPFFSLNCLGIAKLVVERYPWILPIQRSCMVSPSGCGKCAKCRMNSTMYRALGVDVEKFGYPADGVDDLPLGEVSLLADSVESVTTARLMLRGEKYDARVLQAHEPSMWLAGVPLNGKTILRYALGLYDDDFGYGVEQSKWADQCADNDEFWGL